MIAVDETRQRISNISIASLGSVFGAVGKLMTSPEPLFLNAHRVISHSSPDFLFGIAVFKLGAIPRTWDIVVGILDDRETGDTDRTCQLVGTTACTRLRVTVSVKGQPVQV